MTSGSGSVGDDGSGDVADNYLGCPAIVDNHDLPKTIFWVVPPLQDGFLGKGDFATYFVKKYLAARVAQDGNSEEIVDKAKESMS
jgi:hypothetical protein